MLPIDAPRSRRDAMVLRVCSAPNVFACVKLGGVSTATGHPAFQFRKFGLERCKPVR